MINRKYCKNDNYNNDIDRLYINLKKFCWIWISYVDLSKWNCGFKIILNI